MHLSSLLQLFLCFIICTGIITQSVHIITSQPSTQPSTQPYGQPSTKPSRQPSCKPSGQPSLYPSSAPSSSPSSNPSAQPLGFPTGIPSMQPSSMPTNPTAQPSSLPTSYPSSQPTSEPTNPTAQPSSLPSAVPSPIPSSTPTSVPSGHPSTEPTCQPSEKPSCQPSIQPSLQPSSQPSYAPTQPTSQPTSRPTQPTSQPTNQPSGLPSSQPSSEPTQPTSQPSSTPTVGPSCQPSSVPSALPSTMPSITPSGQPSSLPSGKPSCQPSQQPSRVPSLQPISPPSVSPTGQPTETPSSQPKIVPSSQPTYQPQSKPSMQPSMQPLSLPSITPSRQPTVQPLAQPSAQPTELPTSQPSSTPSCQPTMLPSRQPTEQPSAQPSSQPTIVPTCQPSMQPLSLPSITPSCQPTVQPLAQPSVQPTELPTSQPSSTPSCQPTMLPSRQPSAQPSAQPSSQPTIVPTCQPSMQPLSLPSITPSCQPTVQPSAQPSVQPSVQPTELPTSQPSSTPSCQPTMLPSRQPSAQPTDHPTSKPSSSPSFQPTLQPSVQPTCEPSAQPSNQPSHQPSVQPTKLPTSQPSSTPSCQPTMLPSRQPTEQPSAQPSSQPTIVPTCQPSMQPLSLPSITPSCQPTVQPSAQPSVQPTEQPSSTPSCQPTVTPTSRPSIQQSACPSSQPSSYPSRQPTARPSRKPSLQPSCQPSEDPSNQPSSFPTQQLTSKPSDQPTIQPSIVPTDQPSIFPTLQPTVQPTDFPSIEPTLQPSKQPVDVPTTQPTLQPSKEPTSQPTAEPTEQPSVFPSAQSTTYPSSNPSGEPSIQPSTQPTSDPSSQPTYIPNQQSNRQPSLLPSASPSGQPSNAPSALPSAQPILRTSLALIDSIHVLPSTENPASSLLVAVVLLGDDAIVSCGSFYESTPKTTLEVKQQGFSTVSVGGFAYITISNLIPVRNYSIFCYTESLLGHVMTIQEMLLTNATGSTACCRKVYFDLRFKNLFIGTDETDALAVFLDSLPDSDLTIVPVLRISSVSGDNEMNSCPSNVTIHSNSAIDKLYYFTLMNNYTGIANIGLELRGAAAPQYEVVPLSSESLIVLNEKANAIPPQLEKASFSSDRSFIILSFDSVTDRGGYVNSFRCSSIFEFNFADVHQCLWLDKKTVNIYPLDSHALLNTDDVITLIAGTIRAACNREALACRNYDTANSTSVLVTVPSIRDEPNVVLLLPSFVDICTPVLIDLSSSTGSGGRQWLSARVEVVSSESSDILNTFLNATLYNLTIGLPVEIPSYSLQSGITYTITATLCNFLDSCDSAISSFFVADGNVSFPVVKISGSKQRKVTPRSRLFLHSNSYLTGCGGLEDDSSLSYVWHIVQDGAVRLNNTNFKAREASNFILSPFKLESQHFYDITLTVIASESQLSNHATVTVIVEQGPLVAVIRGGTERTVQISSNLTLDASLSRDEDINSFPGSESWRAEFSWSCKKFSSCEPTCPFETISRDDDMGMVTFFVDESKTNISADIVVTVFDTTRSSTAAVIVHTVDEFAPVVEISTLATEVVNIPQNQRLQLSGSIRTSYECEAKWTVDDTNIALADIASTITSARISAGSERVLNLVLGPNTLPSRSTLSFTLTCGGSATSIVVTTNGGPVPGTFIVRPSSGAAVVTLFTLSSSSWRDPDLPLSYQYNFQKLGTVDVLSLKSRSELSFSSTLLPAGVKSYEYKIDCIASIYDAYDAVSTIEATVKVSDNTDAQIQQQNVLDQLEASGSNVELKKSSISVGTAVINTVNCTISPNCTALNREPCSVVEHTCGACVAGCVGDEGHSNSLCVFPGDTDVVNVTAMNAPCVMDSECGVLGRCSLTGDNEESKVCIAMVKACPGDGSCSGNGNCSYMNINTRLLIPTCSMDDTTCRAQCVCSDGFNGPSCSQSDIELQQRQEVRSSLISSLSDVAARDEVSIENLRSWIETLAALTQKPHELTIESVMVIQHIFDEALAIAFFLEHLSYIVLLRLFDVLNDVISAIVQVDLDDNILTLLNEKNLDLLTKVNDFIVEGIVSGEHDVQLVKDNFRSNINLNFFDQNASIIVDTPQTSMELLQHSLHPKISLTIGKDSDLATIVVSLAASAFPKIKNLTSNPLQTKVRVGVNQGSAISTITIVLVHNVEMSFGRLFSDELMTFNTTCEVSDNSVYVHTCPGSNMVLKHECSGGEKRLLSSRCPVLMPSCKLLNISSGIVNSTIDPCEVVAYDAFSTTCECRTEDLPVASSDNNSRRLNRQLNENGETIVLDVVGISEYVGEEFVENLLIAEEAKFDSEDDYRRVLYIIVLFIILWGGGLTIVIGCAWRQHWALKKLDETYNDRRRATIVNQNQVTMKSVQKYLSSYVEEIFPSVFSDRPMLSRIIDEIKRHHRYFTLAAGTASGSVNRAHILTGAQLLSVQTVLIFLLAWLYDVQWSADDGTCESYKSKDDCLRDKTPLDSTQALCEWVSNDDNSICDYREPEFSFRAQIYLAVLVALMTAFFMYPVDAMFDLLSAPTADDIKVAANDKNMMREMGRRVSNAARRVSNAVGSMVNTARASIATGRKSIVGEIARKIPRSTQHAHAVASVSVQGVLEPARARIQSQQLQRLRLLHRSSVVNELDTDEDASNLDTRRARSTSDSKVDEVFDEISTSSEHDAAQNESGRRASVLGKLPIFGNKDRVWSSILYFWGNKQHFPPAIGSKWTQLSEQVQVQRSLLTPSEIEIFDLQWGLDPNGEFIRNTHQGMNQEQGSEEIIRKELAVVECDVKQQADDLKLASDAHIGLEILHLFVIDLLGRYTPAARIFEKKSEEDFQHTKVVTRRSKVLAICVLVGLNFFFIYFTILVGYSRGPRWQRGFVTACAIQLMVEVFIFETMECVWVNYIIPASVSEEVHKAANVLRQAVDSLVEDSSESSDKYFLNAPSFLFVSTNLAKHFPQMMESVLVQSYCNHMPGELAKLWQVGATARIHRYYLLRRTTTLMVLLSTIQYLASAPFIVQRIFVRLVQPFFLIALAYWALFVISSPIYIALFSFLAVCCIGYGVYHVRCRSSRPRKVEQMMITPVEQVREQDIVSNDLNEDVSRRKESTDDVGLFEANESVKMNGKYKTRGLSWVGDDLRVRGSSLEESRLSSELSSVGAELWEHDRYAADGECKNISIDEEEYLGSDLDNESFSITSGEEGKASGYYHEHISKESGSIISSRNCSNSSSSGSNCSSSNSSSSGRSSSSNCSSGGYSGRSISSSSNDSKSDTSSSCSSSSYESSSSN